MYCSARYLGVVIILGGLCSFSEASDKCYFAKTCVHDGKEKCGRDGEGNVRRFIDSCDIKEFNCLKDTGYKKTSLKDCRSLPPIDEQEENNSKDKTKPTEAAAESSEADKSKNAVTESNENVAKESEVETKVNSKETESD